MPDAVRQGESAGPRRGAFPATTFLRRLVPGVLVLLGSAWLMSPLHAEALYRCIGGGGETVFTSSAAGYRGCHRLAGIGEQGRRTAAPAHRPSPHAPAPSNAFANVHGSVQSTAKPAGKQASMPGHWDYHESTAAVAADAPAGSRVLRGAVYRVVRTDGSVEYTNLPPAGGRGHAVTRLFTYIATCAACSVHSKVDWNNVRLNLTSYASAIRAASAEYGVSEAFLRAIIHAESAFNPRALSIKGAQGLMQLMPATASDMGVRDAFDAQQNIRGGARYLARLLATFHGDERLAAAAYNAGPAAVQRYDGVPPYDETRVYVQRVGVLRKRYDQSVNASLAVLRGAGGAP